MDYLPICLHPRREGVLLACTSTMRGDLISLNKGISKYIFISHETVHKGTESFQRILLSLLKVNLSFYGIYFSLYELQDVSLS